MKLVLTKKRKIIPTDVFDSCPACNETELIEVDTDLVCTACDWNSCRYSVDAGLMDNLPEVARAIARPAHVSVRSRRVGVYSAHLHEQAPFEINEIPTLQSFECA